MNFYERCDLTKKYIQCRPAKCRCISNVYFTWTLENSWFCLGDTAIIYTCVIHTMHCVSFSQCMYVPRLYTWHFFSFGNQLCRCCLVTFFAVNFLQKKIKFKVPNFMMNKTKDNQLLSPLHNYVIFQW